MGEKKKRIFEKTISKEISILFHENLCFFFSNYGIF